MRSPDARRVATLGLDAAVGAATLAGLALVATQAVEFGSRRGHWAFAYVARADARLAAIACGLAAVAIALHELGRRAVAAHPGWTVALAFAGGVGTQLVVRGLYPHPMGAIVLSDMVNGFYGAAGRVTPGALLRDFDRVATALAQHPRVNMPGKILLYQAFRAVTDDATAIAMVVVLLSSACGVVLHAIVARAFGSRTLGLDAMTLWMLLPSRIGFLPMLNVVSPLPALAALWCLGRPTLATAAAAGVLLYATAFFDPLALWIEVAFAPVLIVAWARDRVPPARVLLRVTVAAGAMLAVHAAVVRTTGFDVVRRFVAMTGVVQAFNQSASRPYDVWLGANAKDVACALGPALSVAFVAATVGGAWRARSRRPGPAIALGAAASLAAVLLIGLNRGEVARLWIPLFVPVIVAVAWLADGHAPLRWLLVGGTAAWAVLTVATVGYCVP